ncbi:MAG: tail fiber domain-containing protein [Flavobacteriales bacterium]|jgi:hypothetical protein|nr:tail fiber domain-containing protein [Flavobacteriales bacterium]
MKKNKFLGCLAALTITLHASAQLDWNTAGNNITGFEWFGADGTSTIPLQIRHDADQPIEWYTNAIRRMYLQQDLSYQIGSFPGQDKFGHLLLSPDVDVFFSNLTYARGPFTLLHLAAATDNAQEVSYRPWMNTGITFTGNADHGYVGQKAGELDYTDMVIHWSDNPGETLKDRMRFIFTSGFNSAASGAESEEGLEFMRMWPNRYEDPHIGVGDFYAANLADNTITEPTERLDMVNGRLRIRDLPEASGEATGTYKVMVVDDAASGDERGVVKWATLPTPPAGDDCDWELDETTNRLWTATAPIGTNDDCPEKDWLVGIGTSAMAYKLDIDHDGSTDPISGGLRVKYTTGQSGWTYGVKSDLVPSSGGSMQYAAGVQGSVSKATQEGWGLRGTAEANASTTVVVGGVEGNALTTAGTVTSAYGNKGKVNLGSGATTTEAKGLYGLIEAGGGTATKTYGVYGYGVQGTTDTYGAYLWGNGPTDATVYGVYGRATGGGTNGFRYSVYGENAGSGANDWSGYFPGRCYIAGTTYSPSDSNLKTGVEVLSGATSMLMQLNPKRYQYLADDHPQLGLPYGDRFGFLAQEMQAVFPQFVTEVHQPAAYDADGNVSADAMDFLGLSTTELIPLLVAGFQEQQAQIAQLQEQLAICCGNPDGSEQRSGSAVDEEGLTPAQERLLRIAPNPFTDRTTLFCTLERAGRMQLLANSAEGRSLLVLSEGQREAGEFQYEWSTENLAPGVYYITLLLDGEPVVKRAVKVGR